MIEKEYNDTPEDEVAEENAEAEYERLTSTKIDEIDFILEAVDSNYHSYKKQIPDLKGLEDFLQTLPRDEVAQIRKYAVENGIYGNVPLEQMLIMQYGAVFQVRTINTLHDAFKDMIGKAVSESMHKLRTDFGTHIERVIREQNELAKNLFEHEATLQKRADARFVEKEILYERHRNIVNDRYRNEIQTDINKMKQDIAKQIKGAAKLAYAETREELGDNKQFSSKELLAYVAVAFSIGIILVPFITKLLGLR